MRETFISTLNWANVELHTGLASLLLGYRGSSDLFVASPRAHLGEDEFFLMFFFF